MVNMNESMGSFRSVAAATQWWKTTAYGRECSVLIDFTDIGQGFQRRTIRLQRGCMWVMGHA